MNATAGIPSGGESRPISPQPLLDVDRLTVRFGGLVAVSELDLEVPEGTVVSVHPGRTVVRWFTASQTVRGWRI